MKLKLNVLMAALVVGLGASHPALAEREDEVIEREFYYHSDGSGLVKLLHRLFGADGEKLTDNQVEAIRANRLERAFEISYDYDCDEAEEMYDSDCESRGPDGEVGNDSDGGEATDSGDEGGEADAPESGNDDGGNPGSLVVKISEFRLSEPRSSNSIPGGI